MEKTVNIRMAKSTLSALIASAEAGDAVTITRAGKPVVRFVLVKKSSQNRSGTKNKIRADRKPGFLKGQIWIGPDFYDPLPNDILAAFGVRAIETAPRFARPSMTNAAFGYPCKLERQDNGWWLVRFANIPEALTEGETKDAALENAQDCLIAALEGYMKAGRPIPRPPLRGERIVLPSLVTAKLAVYVNMQKHGWSKVKLAKALGMPENSVRRLLDLRHSSHMWIIEEALKKMDSALSIDLPKGTSRRKAA